MEEKLISTQTCNTASHNPWWRVLVVLADKILEMLDVLIRPLSFRILHFVALGEHESQADLDITYKGHAMESDIVSLELVKIELGAVIKERELG